MNEQLDLFVKRYKDDEKVADLVEQAKTMKKSFDEIEKALYQTQNRANQDPLNFPIRLTNKLGHLNSLVTLGDFKPTDQDIAVKNELSSEITKQLDAFDAVIEKDIKTFNDAFNKLELNYLMID